MKLSQCLLPAFLGAAIPAAMAANVTCHGDGYTVQHEMGMDDRLSLYFAGGLVFHWLFLCATGLGQVRAIREAILLRFEKEDLVAELQTRWHAVLDYRLPGPETGLDIADRIRARADAPSAATPVTLLTGEADLAVHADAMARGIPVLRKPLRPLRLRAALLARDRPPAPGAPDPPGGPYAA